MRNPVVEFYFVFSIAVFSSHMYHIKHSKHERMKIYLIDIDSLLKTNCFNHWSIASHKTIHLFPDFLTNSTTFKPLALNGYHQDSVIM